ncbi:MAG TPA: prolyl oligopeptidase family serine peptidase [Ignavibacteria bacterium]|nr:prolyl oligopeptidase family serine peptidase [Ignavibacteria bacterium]
MIINRTEIKLSERNNNLVRSGWGDSAVDDVTVHKITYDSDGIEVDGYLAHPKDISKKYPLVIWNRGGNHKAGLIDEFLAQGMYGEIASWGYVVLASQYRKDEEFGGSDVDDILNLFPVAESLEYCDADNIGMEGWSRGGMMAYKVLTKTDRIKCAVIISGLADLTRNEAMRNDLKDIYKILFGAETDEEFEQRKKERSAVYFYKDINKSTDILLIHGTGDTKISNEDSIDMHEKLKSEGINCELVLIEGGDHYLKKDKQKVAKLRRDWFDKYLKNH